MYIYIYIYIHTHTHVRTHAQIRIYLHICIHGGFLGPQGACPTLFAHIHTHAHTHTFTNKYAYTCHRVMRGPKVRTLHSSHTQKQIYTHSPTDMQTHAYMHTQSCKGPQGACPTLLTFHIHTHTRTHPQIRRLNSFVFVLFVYQPVRRFLTSPINHHSRML